MTPNEIEEVLSLHALPTSTLLSLVEKYLETNQDNKIIEILEPLFSLSNDKAGEEECIALTALCNAYDAMGLPEYTSRKTELLRRLQNHNSKLIRSEAWQRLSVIFLDSGVNLEGIKAYNTLKNRIEK